MNVDVYDEDNFTEDTEAVIDYSDEVASREAECRKLLNAYPSLSILNPLPSSFFFPPLFPFFSLLVCVVFMFASKTAIFLNHACNGNKEAALKKALERPPIGAKNAALRVPHKLPFLIVKSYSRTCVLISNRS